MIKASKILKSAEKPNNKKLKISVEKLSHFRCGYCDRWWSIGDTQTKKKEWYCPWCGKYQIRPN